MSVQSLKPDPTRYKIYYDDTIKGFGVRVAKGGTKAFALSVGKNRDRTTVGQCPIVTLANALARCTLKMDRVTKRGGGFGSLLSEPQARSDLRAAADHRLTMKPMEPPIIVPPTMNGT
jgi:hypothetical protein